MDFKLRPNETRSAFLKRAEKAWESANGGGHNPDLSSKLDDLNTCYLDLQRKVDRLDRLASVPIDAHTRMQRYEEVLRELHVRVTKLEVQDKIDLTGERPLKVTFTE